MIPQSEQSSHKFERHEWRGPAPLTVERRRQILTS